ncbi:MAG: hypothetical protein WDZ85_02430, partial [Candidatus Paceibacterota bacterium]
MIYQSNGPWPLDFIGMDILEKLFGSANRVKLLRLFLFNPGIAFGRPDIAKRSKVQRSKLATELALFKKIKLVRQRKIRLKDDFGRSGTDGFELNQDFPLTHSLRTLLNNDFLRKKLDIAKRFRHCGRFKLLILAGVFLENPDSRIDLFIVGDRLKKKNIEGIIKTIEADIGRELAYALLETEDFMYRFNSSDKFIRDFFVYPHERFFDKI